MNNFKELIEEDIRSKLSSKGVTLAKYAKDVLRAKIGDQRAAGRLDLRNLVAELKSSLERFLGQQGKEPSISSISEFIKYVLGANVPDNALEAMLPNRADIDIQSPNEEEIEELVSQLIENHKSMSPNDLRALIAEITSYINDTEDEDLVIEFMKHIRINHPEILQLPEMEKLAPLGERISDDRVEQLLITIARNMLKNDALAAQNKEAASPDDKSPPTEKSDKTKTDDDPLTLTYKEGLLTREDFFANLDEMKIRRDRLKEWNETNEDGVLEFNTNHKSIRGAFISHYTIGEMNQISALCVTLISQRFSQQRLRKELLDRFEKNPEFSLGRFGAIAAEGYQMASQKKSIDGLIELINQRFKTKEDSSFLLMCCLAATLEVIDEL